MEPLASGGNPIPSEQPEKRRIMIRNLTMGIGRPSLLTQVDPPEPSHGLRPPLHQHRALAPQETAIRMRPISALQPRPPCRSAPRPAHL